MCAILTYFDLVVLFCICGMCIRNKYTCHSLVGGSGQEEVNSHEYECAPQTTIRNVIQTNIGLQSCVLSSNISEKTIMPICMASYMTSGYEHANHAFMVNVRS
jgi:hypothetical protein